MKTKLLSLITALIAVFVCFSVYGCAHKHIEAIDAAIAPTCTAAGKTEGKHCSECGEVLVAQTEVKATGHTETVDAAVAPTCTEAGKTEGKHCSVCNEVLVVGDEIKALGHTEAADAAVAPTCTEAGKTEGKHCSVCNEVLVAQTEIKATGHTEALDAAVAPTCTEAGKTEGKHCSVCNEVLVAQTEIKATGHTEAADAAVAPTCTEAGKTEGKHCSVCNEVLVDGDEIKALGHTEVIDAAVAPTCTAAGKTEGKHCSVCNEVLVAQTEVNATGHTEVIDAAVAATSTKDGLTEGKHCSVCQAVLVAQQTVPKRTTAELCKLHGTLGDHSCILKNANIGNWVNYGVYKDTRYGKSMNYRVFLPRNYDPAKEYPMVIYMHGKGGESMSISQIGINQVLTQSVSYTRGEVICVIPQCLPNCYWPVHPYTTEVVFNLFEDLQKHLSVDKNRIYISGHSYGSMGTLLLLQNHPNYFAAAMVTAGAASGYSSYKNIATTPLRMFCGDKDEYGFHRVMPSLYNNLKNAGADVEYTVWEGKGHGVFSYSAQQTPVVKWLLEQRLDD